MVLIVDDILAIPGKIGGIIFNTMLQTIHKVAWTEYSRELRKLLLRARHDYELKKINREKFQEVERYVFGEMKVAKGVVSGK